jgi:chromosome segregation ATPase
MPSIRMDELSPFGRLALKLDGDFSELSRLSGQLERLDLESESDLDHAVKLLSQFSQHGQEFAQDMQEFSKSLKEAHERSEAAAKSVGERAHQVQERHQRRSQLQDKLALVEHDIKTASAMLAGSRKDDKLIIKAQFEQLSQKLVGFIESGQAIKEEAVRLKFKRIEREALSMLDTLQALRRKIQSILSES